MLEAMGFCSEISGLSNKFLIYGFTPLVFQYMESISHKYPNKYSNKYPIIKIHNHEYMVYFKHLLTQCINRFRASASRVIDVGSRGLRRFAAKQIRGWWRLT